VRRGTVEIIFHFNAAWKGESSNGEEEETNKNGRNDDEITFASFSEAI